MYITVVEGKEDIRKRLLKIRRSLSKEEVLQMSRKIRERLFDLPEYRTSKVVMFYISHDNEVDTREMIAESLYTKKVLVPFTEKENIYPVVIESLNNLNRGAFGILEPREKKIHRRKIDMIIVPGVAFDHRGYRIGYGKGFYDRFLKERHGIKIGLAYDFQIVERIPENEGDIPVDKIITEKRVIECRSSYEKNDP